MTARRKILWINLSLLGVLVGAAITISVMMQGAAGARIFARRLGDSSAARRIEAATALQSFGPSGAPAAPALLAVLQNPEDRAAPACARALREIDAQAAYAYVTALMGRKIRLTPAVIEVYGNFGPIAWRAIPLVRTALEGTEAVKEVVPALIEMGDYGDEVLARIVADSRDPVYSARKWDAMLAFDWLADTGDRIRPELERLSTDATPAVSGEAKNILLRITNAPKYAVSGLAGFPSQSQSYQEYALERLSKQGGRAVEAIPDILRELHAEPVLIRFLAAWTLMHIGPEARAALPELRAAQADPDSLVRDGAADAIRAVEGAR